MSISEQTSSELLDTSKNTPGLPNIIGHGRAFGTFGELLQGRCGRIDSDFLVTFPIREYADATFVSDADYISTTVFPQFKQKSKFMAEELLAYYDLQRGGKLDIKSNLPVGKGLASSSADLVATARAVSSCFNINIPMNLLQDIMHNIEPSDGVMYPGIASFYHREVQLREFLGLLPSIIIVAIDEGGELDTIQFNSHPKIFTTKDIQEYQYLLDTISTAIHENDVETVGQIATRSAVLNQRLNPKRMLNEVITICEEIRGLGVVVAHSGTALGILLSSKSDGYQDQLQVAQKRLYNIAEAVSVYCSLGFEDREG